MSNSVFSFRYNTTTGILRNLFENPNYWNTFTYGQTSEQGNGFSKNAFNFSSTAYWLGLPQNTPNNISFCFRFFKVLTQGYEIKTSYFTSNESLRAKAWRFSGSSDGQNWINYDEIEHSMAPSETFFVEWTSDIPQRCFQLTTLASVAPDGKNRFDLVHIDVYGAVFLDGKSIQIAHLNQLLHPCFLYQILTSSND